MSVGERLVPHVIDEWSRCHPDTIWAEYPPTLDALARGNLINVTWKTLSNSINRLAWWLTEQLGPCEDLETLCYVGPSDIRYFIFAVAACKAGFKVGLASQLTSLRTYDT